MRSARKCFRRVLLVEPSHGMGGRTPKPSCTLAMTASRARAPAPVQLRFRNRARCRNLIEHRRRPGQLTASSTLPDARVSSTKRQSARAARPCSRCPVRRQRNGPTAVGASRKWSSRERDSIRCCASSPGKRHASCPAESPTRPDLHPARGDEARVGQRREFRHSCRKNRASSYGARLKRDPTERLRSEHAQAAPRAGAPCRFPRLSEPAS